VTQPIAFIDLAAQQRRVAKDMQAAITGVLERGTFISGPKWRPSKVGRRHSVAPSLPSPAATARTRSSSP
jgi:hypothetical protein